MSIENILSKLDLEENDIFSYDFVNEDQEDEIKVREKVASKPYDDYLKIIANHHSIPVMDKEVDCFLKEIPLNGTVIDVGGAFGWHWRRIRTFRNDVRVFIVDFVKSNLIHARKILGSLVDDQKVCLVHGDATDLIFDEASFDGWWSVQTLQHIPNYSSAVKEAWRVLKPGGVFANYSLNTQWVVKLIFKAIGKTYHVQGKIPNSFYLARASDAQFNIVERVFRNRCKKKYTEIIFSPELKIRFPGKEHSITGKIDCLLSSESSIFAGIARQQSFHARKLQS